MPRSRPVTATLEPLPIKRTRFLAWPPGPRPDPVRLLGAVPPTHRAEGALLHLRVRLPCREELLDPNLRGDHPDQLDVGHRPTSRSPTCRSGPPSPRAGVLPASPPTRAGGTSPGPRCLRPHAYRPEVSAGPLTSLTFCAGGAPARVDRSRLAGPQGMSRGGADHFWRLRGATRRRSAPRGRGVRGWFSIPLWHPGEDQGGHVARKVALDHRHHLLLFPHHPVQLQHRHPVR